MAFWRSPHVLRGGDHALQVRGERIALSSLSCGPPHFHHRRQHGLRHTPKLRGLLSRPRGSGLEPRLVRSGLSLERLSETVQLGLGRRSSASRLSHQPYHKLRQNCRRCRPLSGFQRCSSGSDIAVSASRRGALHLRRRELLQQRLCSTQVMGVEALGKPAVDRSEKFSKVLIPSPLIAPQPRRANCCAQLK
ncbi:hypothetical protein AB7M67_000261 [Bradyrhizobium japonicum]